MSAAFLRVQIAGGFSQAETVTCIQAIGEDPELPFLAGETPDRMQGRLFLEKIRSRCAGIADPER